jgi:hypothetical protein
MFRQRHAESEPLMTDSEQRDAQGPADGRNPRDDLQEASASSASSDYLSESQFDAPIVVNSGPSKTSAARVGNPTGGNSSNTINDGASGTLHVVEATGEGGSGASTPRFIQDEGHWRRWKWIPYPARRVMKTIARWSRGPPNPQPYRIRPLFPSVQEYPIRLVERFLPKKKQRFWVLFFYFSMWLVGFILLKRQSTLSTEINGWGEPRDIGCGVTYWGPDNNCGVDGNNCRPFNGSGFPFRCPSTCESYHVLNPRAVGDQEVVYRSYVIGGPSKEDDVIYRGDSFICGAAIHAGYITNANGGCGVVEVVGEHDNFASSRRNGIKSVGFDSYFPLSFRFVDVKCEANDTRWSILGFSAAFTGVLSLFTWSPALFFFPNFIAIFWTVGMATDPPNHETTTALFSTILGKFLPAMFCAWVMYDKMGVRRTLKGLTAQIEKTILWLGPCWVGALDNYTLSFIPINRLNAHDLQQQPGAKAALAIIIIVLVVICAMQIWFFRQEGRFLKYLKLYALFIGGIVVSLLLPGVDLRIHHYILALLLLPGTSMQTRPSLIYQGLLIGLFINGIARWGFHSVLQTPDELRGDAQLGTELPVIPPPAIAFANGTAEASNITITWDSPKHKQFDGISILVNDVERFRGYFDDAVGSEDSFTWSRDADIDLPEYFRFAFMDGSNSGDYTKAATWTADGEWVKMKSGPSKVKARRTENTEMIRATVRR